MTSLQPEHQLLGGSYLLSSHLTSAPSHMLQSSLLTKKDTNLSRSTVISTRPAKFTCVSAAGDFDVTTVAETCSNLDGTSHKRGISTTNQLLSSQKLLATSATVNNLLNRLLVANRKNLTSNLLLSTASTKVASEPHQHSRPKLKSKSSICRGCTRLPQNVNMTKSSGAILKPTKLAIKECHVTSPDFVPTCRTSCQNSTEKPCNSKKKKAKKIVKDQSKLAATVAAAAPRNAAMLKKKEERDKKKEESEESADEDMCFGLFD